MNYNSKKMIKKLIISDYIIGLYNLYLMRGVSGGEKKYKYIVR